jgi:hypothetical protein
MAETQQRLTAVRSKRTNQAASTIVGDIPRVGVFRSGPHLSKARAF